MKLFKQLVAGFIVVVGLWIAFNAGAASVTISVLTTKPGAEISADALGLSYETSLLLPATNGVRYFRPDNQPLVQMFRTLGIKSLRIGGNSVDAASIAIPSEEDIQSLFEFAKVAGVKVIYSVRLEEGNPQSAAQITRFIRKRYAKQLDCFAIGNEPKGYYKETNVFLAKWLAIRDAMVAEWPDVTFCGPDDNPSVPWCKMMVANFGAPKGPLKQITQHSYSFGCSYKNPGEKDVMKLIPVDVPSAREKMLSAEAYPIYQKIYDGIVESIGEAPVSFRMTEVNSYWFSGLKGASDRYVSALWSLDYAHWWTQRGANGLNFHTGDRTGGAINLPCRYAAFVTATNGYTARPLAYGLKLFSLAGRGNILPVRLEGETNQNIVAYANLTGGKQIILTLINKAHGAAATNQTVNIHLESVSKIKSAKLIELKARKNDIDAEEADVELGGAPIAADGSWAGKWTKIPADAKRDSVQISLLPASAMLVVLELK